MFAVLKFQVCNCIRKKYIELFEFFLFDLIHLDLKQFYDTSV